MNEVARRVDVSSTTVINHFSTQDQLLEAVVAPKQRSTSLLTRR
jgi:AcrR family transcriptional regulator